MAEHVCPVWIGYLLASPLRKLLQNPTRILGPYVEPGMAVVEVGPAMGFFSLPLARLVGPSGKVLAVDVQAGMINALSKRAKRAGLMEQLEPRLGSAASLGLTDYQGRIDFALAFAVVHEVPDPANLFTELFTLLKPGGRLLLSEPAGHVAQPAFEAMIATAREAGFQVVDRPAIRRSRSSLLKK
jgi:ubiquinone/menaquinone biosynthesis C-methylase UbiE